MGTALVCPAFVNPEEGDGRITEKSLCLVGEGPAVLG